MTYQVDICTAPIEPPCENTTYAHNLCQQHNRQHVKGNKFTQLRTRIVIPNCSVPIRPACTHLALTNAKADGLCYAHYQQRAKGIAYHQLGGRHTSQLESSEQEYAMRVDHTVQRALLSTLSPMLTVYTHTQVMRARQVQLELADFVCPKCTQRCRPCPTCQAPMCYCPSGKAVVKYLHYYGGHAQHHKPSTVYDLVELVEEEPAFALHRVRSSPEREFYSI